MSEAVFDKIADFYDEWYKTPLGEFADKVESRLIFKHLGKIAGLDILDVGCGTGLYSIRCSAKGAKVVGIDSSKEMLKIAKKKAIDKSLKINFIEGNMENIPFSDKTFNIVLSVTSLEFSNNPKKTIKEFFRVLKVGGKLTIGVLSSQSIWGKKRKEKSNEDNIYSYAHFYDTKELKELLVYGGFHSIKLDSSLFVPPNDKGILCKYAEVKENIYKIFTPLNGAFIVGSGIKG